MANSKFENLEDLYDLEWPKEPEDSTDNYEADSKPHWSSLAHALGLPRGF